MRKLLVLLCLLACNTARAQDPMCVAQESSVPLERTIAAYAHEPSVDRVVALAVEALETSSGEARRARRRGRRSGLVPTVRVGAARTQGVDLETDQNGTPTDVATDASLRLDAQLVFDLGRIVYGPDEIAWSRELRAIESVRDARVRDVVEVYFRRRRLQIERDFFCDCSTESAMELAAATALLDVFTAGAFSRIIDQTRESADARATSSHTACGSSERRGVER